jgi:hypothetical protein
LIFEQALMAVQEPPRGGGTSIKGKKDKNLDFNKKMLEK